MATVRSLACIAYRPEALDVHGYSYSLRPLLDVRRKGKLHVATRIQGSINYIGQAIDQDI